MARQALFSDGDGAFAGKRRSIEGDLDITPMIDVTFLLLIFFMVASTMKGTPDVDVPPAEHSIGVDSAGAAVITILAAQSTTELPRIVLGDGDGEETDLKGIRSFVEEQVRAGKRRIVVKAEGDVPHGLVEDVAKAIKEVETAELFMGVGDKPTE